MKFEWDINKEKTNIQQHGITFEQASYVFADPFALNKYDDEHSEDEDRWILLGNFLNEAVLVVVHTFRDIMMAQSLSELSVPEEPQKKKNKHITKGVRYERRI